MSDNPESAEGPVETPEAMLARKFPRLKRKAKPPGLSTINGVGTRLTGRRDFDPETGSYVATQVFSILFIPLIALSAWRVIPAGGSSYHILGQEPLSTLAKRANLAVLAIIAALIGYAGWQNYTGRPEYLANKAMERATEALEEGKPRQAMKEYLKVVENHWPRASEAREAYVSAFKAALRVKSVPEKCVAVQEARHATAGSTKILKEEAALVLAWAKEEPDADAALTVMKNALPGVPPTERAAFDAHRRGLLEKVLAARPASAETAIDLAEIYDSEGRTEECGKLLEPHRTALGTTEGARIYGRLLVHEGKHKEGAELLRAYAGPKLADYHAAEQKLEAIYKSVSDAAIAKLNNNSGPPEFYREYQNAGPDTRQRLVDDFVAAEVSKSTRLTTAQEQLAAASNIVPVLLDLGIATLRVAQEESVPQARQAGLEEAEKAFLAIQGSAGETAEYRLFLGQVYYWLGKTKEGKQLFDDLIAAEKQGPVVLMVSESLRQVGEMEEARRVSEKAWEASKSDEERHAAAAQRAVMWRNTDDRIAWLERSDKNSPSVKVNLLEARAHKKMDEGDRKAAVPLLREALAHYDKQPRSDFVLNNSANLLSTLYSITHDPADSREALNRHEEATKLNPEDTVLLTNLASGYLSYLWLELMPEGIDLKSLPSGTENALAALAHTGEAEQAALTKRVAASESVRKAAQLYSRLTVLAPRDPSHLRGLQSVYELTRQTEALQQLARKSKDLTFDHGDSWEESARVWKEDRAQESLTALTAQKEEYAAALKSLPPTAPKELGAALESSQLSIAIGQSKVTGTGDAGALTAGAEALLKLHDGYGIQLTASRALLRAAVLEGSKVKAFADFAEANRRYLGDIDIIALALEQKLAAEALLASPALKRWLALELATWKRWPENTGISDWAVIRHLDSASAEPFGAQILQSERYMAILELDQTLAPFDIDSAVNTYFMLELQNKPDLAGAHWDALRKKGMPLPDLAAIAAAAASPQ